MGDNGSNKIWLNGELVCADEARISVFDHAVLYGDGCFEGIRAYGGRVFKLASHLDRMYASAAKLRLTPPYPKDEIARAIRETLAGNDLADAYIRLVFTRGVGTLGLHPFRCPKATAFVIADAIELYPPELYENGMEVIVATRRRIPIESLDPAIKSLNYLNNILAKIEAIDADVLEAIMLNVDGQVSECTGDNIFVVADGVVVTPSACAGILHGVTRRFVMEELAPALGHAVEERSLTVDEILGADEVFLTGTAAEIIGVIRIDGRTIGSGAVGPVTRSLTAEFRRRVSTNAPEN